MIQCIELYHGECMCTILIAKIVEWKSKDMFGIAEIAIWYNVSGTIMKPAF